MHNNDAVNVYDPVTFFSKKLRRFFKKKNARNVFETHIAVGERFSDVSEFCRAHNGVDNRMNKNIGVRMSVKSLFKRNFNSAENKFSARREAVRIVAYARSHKVILISFPCR